MKKVLLVYKTKTGFTKQYVDWITEEVKCEVIAYEKLKTTAVENFDIIIYGASIHAGHISGLNEFRKRIKNVVGKRIIFFATGGAPGMEEVVEKIIENNLLENEKTNIKFFYFQSGLNYEKMALFDKMIMKTYSKILSLKSKKTKIEDGTSKAVLASYNNSSKEYIKPMISYLKEIIYNN
jgi:menaquinone-dependent protoporphyrinogen IX oxidase